MLGRHGLETYVTPVNPGIVAKEGKGQIIEVRRLCNEIAEKLSYHLQNNQWCLSLIH